MGQVARKAAGSVKLCGFFRPGHQVHHIQAHKAISDPSSAVAGVILSLSDRIVTSVNNIERTFFNHDIERLAAIVEAQGSAILIQTTWSILHIDSFLFSISRDPITSCPRTRRDN